MGKHINRVMAAALLAATLSAPIAAAAPAEAARACSNIAHRAMYGQTEEQVRGVARNRRWGFTEVDARITADGRVVAIHDLTVKRISGDRSREPVRDLTMRQIRRLPYEFGRRVETTGRLIREAGEHGSAIMVTVHSYARYQEAWDGGGLEALWNAAQAHGKPARVYFGGGGAARAMRIEYGASTFHRYTARDDVRQHVEEHGVDLAALPKAHFDRRLVRGLKRDGIRVASIQLDRKRAVRQANRAGISLVQTDRGKRTVRRWCR